MSKNQLSCVFILFVGGMLADLLLIEHFESAWQLVPVLFLAVAMLTFLCLKKWPALTGFFRAWMYLGMVSGIVGLFLHARNNWEFAVELYANSANLFDSLAEGYLFTGNRDKAIENFEKSSFQSSTTSLYL